AAVGDALDGGVRARARRTCRAELLPVARAAALDEDVDLFVFEILVDEAVRELSDDPLRVTARVDHVATAVVRRRERVHVRERVRERSLRAERRSLAPVAGWLREARLEAATRAATRGARRAGRAFVAAFVADDLGCV